MQLSLVASECEKYFFCKTMLEWHFTINLAFCSYISNAAGSIVQVRKESFSSSVPKQEMATVSVDFERDEACEPSEGV